MTIQSSCMMQRRVLLMRHAESSNDDTSVSDHQRPLHPRGTMDTLRIAHALQRLNWIPTQVFVSDSKRTLATLEGLKTVLGEVTTETMDSLYHAPTTTIVECLQNANVGGVTLILSHNPGTELVLYELTGEFHVMTPAACALLVHQDGEWQCQHILRPKELDE